MPKSARRGNQSPKGRKSSRRPVAREAAILRALDTLSPRGRKAALQRLLADSGYWDRILARNRPRILALARERGVDWDQLPEDAREALVDRILHEP